MRISDWSSDVCSSDLFILVRERLPNSGSAPLNTSQLPDGQLELRLRANDGTADGSATVEVTVHNKKSLVAAGQIGRTSCRERVCQSVKISVGAVQLKKKK